MGGSGTKKYIFASDELFEWPPTLFLQKIKPHPGKTKLGIQSFSYVGPSTWNSLLDNLKYVISVSSFKLNIKK